jgi:hypothetical protein
MKKSYLEIFKRGLIDNLTIKAVFSDKSLDNAAVKLEKGDLNKIVKDILPEYVYNETKMLILNVEENNFIIKFQKLVATGNDPNISGFMT